MIFEILEKLFSKSEKVMDTLADCKAWMDDHTTVTMAVGTACTVAGTVVACKETVKLMEKKPEFEAELEAARAESEALKAEGKPCHKPLVKVYGKIAGSCLRTYAGAIALTGVGLGLEWTAHFTNLANTAKWQGAYFGLKSSYDALEKKLKETEEGKKFVAEEAKKKKLGENTAVEGDINGSVIEFNSSCKEFFEGNPRANGLIVTSVITALEDKFIRRGHIYLNDICRYLGRKPLKHGWEYVRVRRGANDKLDFGLGDATLNGGFCTGVDDVCRFLIKDFVPASVLYDKKYKDMPFYLGDDGTAEVLTGGEVRLNNDALGAKPVVIV